jgi:hypothetical protein
MLIWMIVVEYFKLPDIDAIPPPALASWNDRQAHRTLIYNFHLSQWKKVVYRSNHCGAWAQARKTQSLGCPLDHRQPRGWYVYQAVDV